MGIIITSPVHFSTRKFRNGLGILWTAHVLKTEYHSVESRNLSKTHAQVWEEWFLASLSPSRPRQAIANKARDFSFQFLVCP